MPDPSLVEAGKTLVEAYGATGAWYIVLFSVIAFAVKQWIDNARKLNEEKDKHLETVKLYASESFENRKTQEANTTAINTLLNFYSGKAKD